MSRLGVCGPADLPTTLMALNLGTCAFATVAATRRGSRARIFDIAERRWPTPAHPLASRVRKHWGLRYRLRTQGLSAGSTRRATSL